MDEKNYRNTGKAGYRNTERRILLAVLTGVALAAAGAVMQGLLRNPLVSPFTLGLSSAASFGAALMIVLGPAIFGAFFAGSVVFLGLEFTTKSLMLILSAFLFEMRNLKKGE